MISAIIKSKNPLKVTAVIYLALYQIFLFSFLNTGLSGNLGKTEKLYSCKTVTITELNSSRPLDISKNETPKDRELNSFASDHSPKFILSNEVPAFLTKGFIIIKSNKAYLNACTEKSETLPRSPPYIFS